MLLIIHIMHNRSSSCNSVAWNCLVSAEVDIIYQCHQGGRLCGQNCFRAPRKLHLRARPSLKHYGETCMRIICSVCLSEYCTVELICLWSLWFSFSCDIVVCSVYTARVSFSSIEPGIFTVCRFKRSLVQWRVISLKFVFFVGLWIRICYR